VSAGITTNGLQIGDVKALQNISSLVEYWWLLYCLSAVIGCPYFGMIINNLK
jgi:hypothetical protein